MWPNVEEMKHYTLLLIGLSVLLLTSCKDWWKQGETDEGEGKDTLVIDKPEPVLPDSTIWGHLGEDSGMSALEFITDDGDTLELYRTNPYTGEDGRLMGDIRNYKDHFAITLDAGGETMLTAINTTQLKEVWQKAKTEPYDGWTVGNGQIVLSSQQKQEVGIVTRLDTMTIEWLDSDSLVIRNHINQLIKFDATE